jgi:hypothetical protein
VRLKNVAKLAAQAAIVAPSLRAQFGKQVMRQSADAYEYTFVGGFWHGGMPLFFGSKTKDLQIVNLFFQKILQGVKTG